MTKLLIASLLPLLSLTHVTAQNRIGTGKVAEIYEVNCASCHGRLLDGGQGSSLIDGQWTIEPTEAAIADAIRSGNETLGMPAFEGTLSDEDIRSLVILIHEKELLAQREAKPDPEFDKLVQTELYDLEIQEVTSMTGTLWSLDFLPNGDIITTQKNGNLWIHSSDTLIGPILGTPTVKDNGQGGLLDVAIHPDYESNKWIYLSYVEGINDEDGMTAIVRGKVENGEWVDQESIYFAEKSFYTNRRHHFGTRIVFKDEYLFFGIGDRGQQDQAQDISRPNGKIHRLYADGRIPENNPFAKNKEAIPSIWAYGNRNPQGLVLHPETGNLWEAEHGPRGGDEINLIEAGNNYGWPVITYGMNYNGSPITDIVEKPDMEQPKHYWTPSIAVSGISFYSGNTFSKWKHNLFVGGLSAGELHRLEIHDNEITSDEILFRTRDRIRDVVEGPDGLLYIIINSRSRTDSTIYKLRPVE
ncbi:PQQ-dependent sugar dehydrogenase [Puniceicoccaceae bacterium K14]|nr:PQQ-dependent sugar dehydrogenase [Puniceicoccaceae bacterium K14]